LDPAVGAASQGAHALWFTGYPDQAHERSLASLAFARASAHPFSLCFALKFDSVLRVMRGQLELAASQNEAKLAVAREHDIQLELTEGLITDVWIEALTKGQCDDERAEAAN